MSDIFWYILSVAGILWGLITLALIPYWYEKINSKAYCRICKILQNVDVWLAGIIIVMIMSVYVKIFF